MSESQDPPRESDPEDRPEPAQPGYSAPPGPPHWSVVPPAPPGPPAPPVPLAVPGPPAAPAYHVPPGPPPSALPSSAPPPPAPPPPAPPAWQPGPSPTSPTSPTWPAAPDEPGRDPLAAHMVWEAFLGLVAIVLVGVFLAAEPDQAMTTVLRQAGAIGMLAAGLSLSLRTGTPNLAVGALAGFTGGLAAYLSFENGWSMAVAMTAGVAVAVAIGVIIGVLTAALSVPAWAVTFGAASAVQAGLLALTGPRIIVARISGPYPTGTWFGLFLVISIGGGVLWLLPGVRRPLSAVRRSGEPGRWGGLLPGLGALVGLAGSSFLAGLGGVANLSAARVADPTSGPLLGFFALAAALLGGASIFGRRAGVTGTVSAVMIILIVRMMLVLHAAPSWAVTLFAALMVLLGLAVSRALESITNVLTAGSGTPAAAFPGVPPPAPPPLA